jgi:ribosome-associated translation inhibitor RaiA
MDILPAIQREERKLEKQLRKEQHKLSGVRAAAKTLRHSAEGEVSA